MLIFFKISFSLFKIPQESFNKLTFLSKFELFSLIFQLPIYKTRDLYYLKMHAYILYLLYHFQYPYQEK